MRNLILTCLLLLVTSLSFASDKPLSNRERWKNMSADQKQAIREKYSKFMNLPDKRKQQLVQRFKMFKGFNATKKQKIVRRFRRLNRLKPERRKKIRRRWALWKKLSPEQKRDRLQKLKEFRVKRGLRNQRNMRMGARPNRETLRNNGRPFNPRRHSGNRGAGQRSGKQK